MESFYQFRARLISGEEIPMERYAGKVVLVVNTASKCGFTPQYAGLEELYRKYKDRGLMILGFPCNQFGNQEPGDATSIQNNCLVNYGVTFPVFDKVEVNGEGAHPIFSWLTAKLPGFFGRKIRWNFTKFVLGKDGRPRKRFAPSTKPAKLECLIQELLR